MSGVIAAHWADGLNHGHGRQRDSATLIAGIRVVKNAVAVGIGFVVQMAIGTYEHPGRSCLGEKRHRNQEQNPKAADKNVLQDFEFSSTFVTTGGLLDS